MTASTTIQDRTINDGAGAGVEIEKEAEADTIENGMNRGSLPANPVNLTTGSVVPDPGLLHRSPPTPIPRLAPERRQAQAGNLVAALLLQLQNSPLL